jgi:hypothetical protein
MNDKTLTEQLIILAKDIEKADPIDWAMLSINEDDAYHLMASEVLEMYLGTDKEDRDMVLLAVAVHLTVENFELNLRLLELSTPK